jgi:hypothetical protein
METWEQAVKRETGEAASLPVCEVCPETLRGVRAITGTLCFCSCGRLWRRVHAGWVRAPQGDHRCRKA